LPYASVKGVHDNYAFVAGIEKEGPLLCGGCLVGALEAMILKGQKDRYSDIVYVQSKKSILYT
jgi:hypothetical protein